MNEGVWIVKDNSQKFVLKLVKGVNSFGMPTDAEKFTRLSHEHPGIEHDASIAFPMQIIRCTAPGQGNRYDLIVMRKVPGKSLSETIANLRSEGRMPQLMQILEKLGQFLADFHARYSNKQHNDFQPSNVFYDPVSGSFTLIDISDMGPTEPLNEVDVERFTNSLSLLSNCYGQNFFLEGKRHFEAGYNQARRF